MRYCSICHKSKDEQHFIDFPEHAKAKSKAQRAPRGGHLTDAPQPVQRERAPRPPRAAQTNQGGEEATIPGGWLLAGLGILGAAFGGMAAYNYRQKKAQQGNQGGQSQRIKIEPEGSQDNQGDPPRGGSHL